MALSNLIWWPWFGVPSGVPPVVGTTMFAGDKNPPLIPDSWGEVWRGRRRREEEDEDLISLVLDSL